MEPTNVFAFYDHTSTGRRGARWVLAPAQRVLRRVLRPMYYRLRDLLQMLADRQQAQADRLAALEHAHQQLAQAHQALLLDHTAAARRVILLEDLILQAGTRPTDPAGAPRVAPLTPDNPGRAAGVRLAG